MRLLIAAAILLAGSLPAAAQSKDCRNEDRTKQIEQCTAIIRDATVSDPRKATAYLYRCQAHDMLKRYNEARIDCLEALRLGDDPSAWNSLSIVYQNRGRLNDAVDASNKAVAKSDRANYLNTRSNANCRAGNVDASVRDRMEAMNRGHFKPASVQSILKSKGYYNGLLDGKFGESSRAALRAWTRDGCR